MNDNAVNDNAVNDHVVSDRPAGVKFYQVGSFAVGNRLLGPGERSAQSDAQRPNTLISGHRACQGCGEVLGARYVLDAAMRASGGWGAAASQTIRLARLATESGLFPLFEAENGEVTSVTVIRRLVAVDGYLRGQARYAHLFEGGGRPDVVARIQAGADRNIRRYGLLETAEADEGARS